MTYDEVATISQVTSLLFFITFFIGVLAYALWPGNGQRFDAIQKRALGLDEPSNQPSNSKGADR